MSAYFALRSHAPASAALVLVNGPPYSPWVLVGKDIGNPSWQHQFSGARGTQGRRPATGVPDDRRATFGLLSDGQASKDQLAALLSALVAVVDEIRRFGGQVTWREHAQAHRQHLDVLVGEITVSDWGSNEFNLRDALRPALTLTCGPYALGDPMDISDDFSTDSLGAGDYTVQAGALSNLAVAGGQLTPIANLTTESQIIHTQRGYRMGDQEAQIAVTPGATLSGFKAGVIVKRIDASNYVESYLTDNGSTSTIEVAQVVAGVRNVIATSSVTRIVTGTVFWLRGAVYGARANVTYFTAHPATGNPDASGTRLNPLVDSALAQDATGRAGILWNPRHASSRIDDFLVRAFVAPFLEELAGDVSAQRHRGAIPGDAPALADVSITIPISSTRMQFGLFSWWRAPATRNLVMEGGFEGSADLLVGGGEGVARGWIISNVSGFMGACTSITRTLSGVTPLHGRAVGVAECPATASTGPKVPIRGRFELGETYTAVAWVRAPSATTNVRLRVGDPADSANIASTTAAALTSAWTQRTVTWTCRLTTDLIYVGVEITAATATTFHLDAVQVYRGTTPPTTGRHALGQGAYPPFGVIEAESAWAATVSTVVSSASASSGAYLRDDGGALFCYFILDPSLSRADDYSDGSLSFTVFARVLLSSAFTGGVRAFMGALPEDTLETVVFPAEQGQSGVPLVMPSSGNGIWRLARLGSLTLPVEGDDQPRWILGFEFQIPTTGGQSLGIDYFALVPARSHVLSPTGKLDDAYFPDFVPSSTRPQTRIIRSDTSGYRADAAAPAYRASGLGGALIELPPGDLETLSLVSSLIPDSPTGSAVSETFLRTRTQLAVTPRWSYLRDAPS